MAFGGSRSGKTFELCRTLCLFALVAGGRYAIFRQHFNSVRTSVFMDTIPMVLKLCFPGQTVELNKSDTYFFCPATGGEIWGLGLDDKERVDKILGKEFTAIYFNECSEISFHAVETALTRVSQQTPGLRNRIFFDCNPPSKAHWAYKLFIQKTHPETRLPLTNPEQYAAIQMNPIDNAENLPQGYIEQTLGNLSLNKRKRFLLGEWSDDNENALWKMSMIDPYRKSEVPSDLERIVVGVDPAVTNSENSDYTGIMVVGKKQNKSDGKSHFYVLDDQSLLASPHDWAVAVCNTYRKWNADKVIAETNQGGDLVVETLRNVDAYLPVRTVRATRGKIVRAEPIAALYEQGLVHHVGLFEQLEEELTSYTGEAGKKSPDRMDALVWALTDLSEQNSVSGGTLWFD